MKHFLALFFLSLWLVGCTECGRKPAATDSSDAPAPAGVVATPVNHTDTLRGFVGDGTSMNLIELVNAEATDTVFLELGDDVDRQATLTVGNEVAVVVRQEADGSQTVLSTADVN